MRLFRRLQFRAKALIISLALLVPTIGLIALQLVGLSNQVHRSRYDAVRQHVEIAHGVITWAHGLETSGRLSRADAQALAAKAIGSLRYEESEYFWINDLHPRVVVHPTRPELVGREAGDVRDPNGLPLFVEFARTARTQGSGFVPYQWPRPGQTAPVDKVAFVMGFEPWGWVVGTGVYIDDIRVVVRRQLVADLAVIALVLVVGSYLFLSFYRVMDGGLAETRRHLRAMTQGDLTTSPSPWGRDEAASLMLDLRAMQDALRTMVASVREASDGIVQASGQISAGAQDLSSRTEQSAANLEQTASAMEQIAATVQASADHTHKASEIAHRNSETADGGGRTMDRVNETMKAILEASSRIGDITATIDALAFQSNILALNAAVEAARAGDQGRGFAVVAAEVRSLAQRSATSAREIKALIGETVARIESGAEVVHDASTRMASVVAGSREVSDRLQDIATGAREQSRGVEQVGAAVGELDRMTQQNAALVEQTAAAAAQMSRQARALADQVQRFKLP